MQRTNRIKEEQYGLCNKCNILAHLLLSCLSQGQNTSFGQIIYFAVTTIKLARSPQG